MTFQQAATRLDPVRDQKRSWSEHGQDLYVDSLFFNRTNGFFVEIGAFDGETASNTLYLEKNRGWDGLLECWKIMFKITRDFHF